MIKPHPNQISAITKWLAAAALAIVLSATWDSPTEIETAEAIAAEVAALSGGEKGPILATRWTSQTSTSALPVPG